MLTISGALLVDGGLLCLGAALYLPWRANETSEVAWLIAVLAALGLQGAYWTTLSAGGVVGVAGHPLLTVGGQALGALAVVLVLRFSDRLPAQRAPLTTGAVAGLGIIAVRSLVAGLDDGARATPPLDTVPTAVCVGLAALLAAALVAALLRSDAVPAWVRLRLSVVALLLTVERTAAVPTQHPWPGAVGVTASLLAALVLTTTAAMLARATLEEERQVVTLLQTRLHDVEEEVRTDRSRAHEIRATLAGIASASSVLHHGASSIAPVRRTELEAVMDAELARLGRLLSDNSPVEPGPVDLDATLRPVVLRSRLCGHVVHWEPSRGTAWGRPDDVAEIVSVLLENSRQHARGAETWIDVVCSESCVEIRVSDSGPGVDPLLRPAIFAWGGRRPDSGGEGIGLNTAVRLSTALGGDLRLVDSSRGGATFVLSMPSSAGSRGRGASA